MRGSDVRTLQRDLTASGFATTASGVFGRITRNHVIAFQSRSGLVPDGVVGSLTLVKLEAAVASKQRSGKASSSETAKTGAASLGSTTTTTPSSATATTTTTTTTATTPTTTTTTPTTTTTATSTASTTGAAGAGPAPSDAPVEPVTLNAEGLAVPPADAPPVIVELIAAANRISHLPYIYGGGHDLYQGDPVALDAGYDCSGSVSFALHGAGLLAEPLDSTQFESWGTAGAGSWITLYTNAGHVYMNVAGLWFDTGAQSFANGDDRWSATRASPAAGFMVLHPTGW
ncbi:MAG: peptidoglycan-binding domain-containing protein [Solirubrobacteraceae bacterium]